MRVGEFLLLEELGAGAFGRVFLAGQEELNRRVALKVSLLRSMSAEEGKSLGGLEHDHIVKVYSEFTHPTTGWHCLCLQYIPGADLRAVIAKLHAGASSPASGRDLLAAIDAVGRKDEAFDPSALRDRDSLASDNFPQAVCRIGERLAEALAFAHAKGVLHCDIKPGNILITPYGRPMLADFNVAFHRGEKRGTDSALGGTLAYMAPEYLLAIQGGDIGSVDERCDVYSLGMVLHELATGMRPYLPGSNPLDRVPHELAAVIRRSLDPVPSRRYQSAADLADALSGAWHLLAARRALPRSGKVGRRMLARPLTALAAAALVPHFVASLINISYNAVQIHLSEGQREAFESLVVAYNLVVYPLCAAFLFLSLRGIGRRLSGLARADGPASDDLRRRARGVCWLALWVGMLGWFPGGVLFPLGIDLRAGPVSWRVYAHFAVSFVLAGLVGVVFSYLGVVYVVFLTLLPRSGNPDTYRPGTIGDEVRPLTGLIGPCLLLSSAVPLTGAVLLIVLAGEVMTLGFRLLVAGLIVLGMGGIGLAARIANRLFKFVTVWEWHGDADSMPPTAVSWDRRRSGMNARPGASSSARASAL